jgi:NTP pyrophosphatase (non-canonical NTP hydrolase)
MTTAEIERVASSAEVARLSVVLCGSYRRDHEALERTFDFLRQSFTVLSPESVSFVGSSDEFVRLPWELNESPSVIEARHLNAIASADFVWLHAPDGYVGVSAAREIGHAAALGIPIFTDSLPTDEVLAAEVVLVGDPGCVSIDAITARAEPGHGLNHLQRYYESTASRRGWDKESAEETLQLLRGELEELAVAMAKQAAGISIEEDGDADVSGEIADVQLYLVHLANALGLDLSDAVSRKESINALRFESVSRVA